MASATSAPAITSCFITSASHPHHMTQKAKLLHPDSPNAPKRDPALAKQQFVLLMSAYQVLRNPSSRKQYVSSRLRSHRRDHGDGDPDGGEHHQGSNTHHAATHDDVHGSVDDMYVCTCGMYMCIHNKWDTCMVHS